MLKNQHRFQESGNAGGSFKMANIRFNRNRWVTELNAARTEPPRVRALRSDRLRPCPCRAPLRIQFAPAKRQHLCTHPGPVEFALPCL